MAHGKSLTLRAIQPPSPRMFWDPKMSVKRNGEVVSLGPYVDPKRKERKTAAKARKAERRKYAKERLNKAGRGFAQMLADYRAAQDEHMEMWRQIEKEILGE